MKLFPLFFFLAVISFNSQAEFFEVEDIRIDGLERVSSATVFNSLSVSVGDVVDRSSVRDLTRDLFRLGFFNDIKISRDKGILIISVTERPAVAKLIIEGNTAIPEETLFSSLRDNGLSEGQIFRQAVLKGMSQELERQYVKQGRYGAGIEIEVEEHPWFERSGPDLIMSLPLGYADLVLGTSITLEHLDGKDLTIKIPSGTQHGKQLRLREKGMPLLRGNRYGDLYIKIITEVPASLNSKQKELLEEFRKIESEKSSPIIKNFFEKAKKFWKSS